MTIDLVLRAQRIEQFLNDEAIIWALDELQKANYAMFVKAQNTDELITAQARQQAFAAFEQSLRAIVGAGEFEQHQREHGQDVTDR